MARKAYIGVQTSHTYTNMLGGIGDMETGTVYKTTAEAAYLKNSSQHKFGSSSQAFQQSGSATELTYTLRNSSGQMSFALDNTHQYYFSVWIRQNTSLDLSFDWYWPIAEPSVMSGVKNAALNTWEHHSAVVSRSGFTSGSYPMRIDCNNYPGNNALMYVDGLMVIDLTATYGAGNEPTKEFCDQYFAFTTGTNTVTIPTAREVKKMYIGVGGVARKVKKGYIGVGGVARLFFSSGLAYYGTISALNTARYRLAATTIGNYALFGGGMISSSNCPSVVDAYDTSLTRTTADDLSRGKGNLAAATIGNYALFGGGNRSSNYYTDVDAYNISLTRTTADDLSTGRTSLAATTIGNYALFGGGSRSSSSNIVDAYNTSLTRTTATALSTARDFLAATTVGNYALFGGGDSANDSSTAVDAYDTSLTRTTAIALSEERTGLAATTIGNYALFGGGAIYSNTCSNVVDAYNTSLTRTTATALSTARRNLTAETVGDYALFGGGMISGSSYSNVVDAYDTSLTRTTATALSTGRSYLAAATVGDYALFGGGDTGSASSVVDVYTT